VPDKAYAVPMTTDLSDSIEKTLELLKPYVSFVPLKEEYLRQPQYLYMFDIITGVSYTHF